MEIPRNSTDPTGLATGVAVSSQDGYRPPNMTIWMAETRSVSAGATCLNSGGSLCLAETKFTNLDTFDRYTVQQRVSVNDQVTVGASAAVILDVSVQYALLSCDSSVGQVVKSYSEGGVTHTLEIAGLSVSASKSETWNSYGMGLSADAVKLPAGFQSSVSDTDPSWKIVKTESEKETLSTDVEAYKRIFLMILRKLRILQSD